MSIFDVRGAQHAARPARSTKGFRTLTALGVVGLVVSVAPIVSALTESPAAATPVISAVGSLTTVSGSGITSVGANPQHVGDVLVVMAEEDNNTVTVSSMSGGGVTTWNRAIQYDGVGEPREYDLWYGTVTATGSSTINVTWSGPLGGMTAEYEVQEFGAGLGPGTGWSLDTTNSQENPSSTTVTYPSLTPAASGELYFGFMDMPQTPSAGSTSGFTYATTADANQIAYNPAVGSGTVQPTSSQFSAGASSGLAMLLVVHAPPPIPTVTAVNPSGGPLAGGNTVTVTGTTFSGATAVTFGSTAGTNVIVNGGGTSLTVTAPAEAAATIDVTVTTISGTSATGGADKYTYFPVPTVTAVNPNLGPSNGGTSVTVTGTNLTGTTAVHFGSNSGTGVSVNGGGTSLTVKSPAGAVGIVDVTVVTPGGTSTTKPADQFTYQKSGYWMAGSDGSVFSFGSAPFKGSLPMLNVHVSNIVGLVPTADGQGYWMVGRDGGVFAFGDAGFVGSLPGLNIHVNNIVGAVPTATGKGYWMVGRDGGVFAFGDAGFVGSLPGLNIHVNNIVAAVPTATGKGYWMIGSDGGVFAFGDAGFVGSLPGINIHINNVVGAVPTSSGKGYWMIGSDGGVFAFGDAGFLGSLPGLKVHVTNVVGVVATQDNQGYWMVGNDGGVFAFGDAAFLGSIPSLGLHVSNIVAFARQ
ncbi:MAG TPA: IPT/TIG domain-containing protein [Acidimicrobiales bacterium]|nr:IPT/TIG domain-containing protein [Acidimicrobiales bacterium]